MVAGPGLARVGGLHGVGIRPAFVVFLSATLVGARANGQLWFTEQSSAAGVIATHAPATNLVFSPYNVAAFTSGGVTGDFNNDGFQDLFVLTTGGSPDKLFINNGDGTFVDRAALAGLAVPHMGIGAAAGDYDNDGRLDLYVTSFGPASQSPAPARHKLYHNNGDGTFTDVAVSAGVNRTSVSIPDGFGAAFGDYDLDGDLDLFVAGWNSNSGGNRLFRNNGDGTFSDVTDTAGVQSIDVRGYSPRFVDMTGDGFPELLLAADFQTSRYFVNNANGTFSNMTTLSGTGLDANGMGHTVGDFDGDGRLDWYVTSIYGNYPVPGIPGTGNMLYMNHSPQPYTEVSQAAGVKDGGWGWGTIAVDFDHDGLLDIAETNGWPGVNGLGQHEWSNEQSYLWKNTGTGVFAERAVQCNLVHYLQGRGMLNFDYDNDGDQDVVIFAYAGPVKLYRNDLLPCSSCTNYHWLRVFLNTAPALGLAADGFGSRVSTIVGGQTQFRVIDGGCNYLSQSELSAHFGLGAAVTVNELRVAWADGRVTRQFNVAANQTITIAAPAGRGGDMDIDTDVDAVDFAGFLHAFGGCTGAPAYNERADPDSDGCVTVADYDIWLRQYRIFSGTPLAGPPIPSDAGDLNGDGLINAADVAPFVHVVLNPATAGFREGFVADANGDGMLTTADIGPFVQRLLSGGA